MSERSREGECKKGCPRINYKKIHILNDVLLLNITLNGNSVGDYKNKTLRPRRTKFSWAVAPPVENQREKVGSPYLRSTVLLLQ